MIMKHGQECIDLFADICDIIALSVTFMIC